MSHNKDRREEGRELARHYQQTLYRFADERVSAPLSDTVRAEREREENALLAAEGNEWARKRRRHQQQWLDNLQYVAAPPLRAILRESQRLFFNGHAYAWDGGPGRVGGITKRIKGRVMGMGASRRFPGGLGELVPAGRTAVTPEWPVLTTWVFTGSQLVGIEAAHVPARHPLWPAGVLLPLSEVRPLQRGAGALALGTRFLTREERAAWHFGTAPEIIQIIEAPEKQRLGVPQGAKRRKQAATYGHAVDGYVHLMRTRRGRDGLIRVRFPQRRGYASNILFAMYLEAQQLHLAGVQVGVGFTREELQQIFPAERRKLKPVASMADAVLYDPQTQQFVVVDFKTQYTAGRTEAQWDTRGPEHTSLPDGTPLLKSQLNAHLVQVLWYTEALRRKGLRMAPPRVVYMAANALQVYEPPPALARHQEALFRAVSLDQPL